MRDWSASQSNTIRQPPVRPALCSVPFPFRSQRFLAGTDSRNVRVFCAPLCWSAGVWATGPGPLLAIQQRLGLAALHCNAQWSLFLLQRGEEEPLPGAPARHGRPFLCEALMATRWRMKREEEGVLCSLPLILYFFCLCMVNFSTHIQNLSPAKSFILLTFISSKGNCSLNKGGWQQKWWWTLFLQAVYCAVFF